MNVLNCKNAYPGAFLCSNRKVVRSRIHRIITNIYFNSKHRNWEIQFEMIPPKISHNDKEKDKKHTKEF